VEQTGDMEVKALISKIQDDPRHKDLNRLVKNRIGLDPIQRRLMNKSEIGVIDLNLSKDMKCPPDSFLETVNSGYDWTG